MTLQGGHVAVASIFLSYARPDRAFAEAIADTLHGLGHEVWWDHQLLPAEDFRAAIAQQLEMATAVVVLWSAYSIESQWVIDEAERGSERRKLIPIALPGMDARQIPIGLNRQHLIFAADLAPEAIGQVGRQVVAAVANLRGGRRSVSVAAPLKPPSKSIIAWGVSFLALAGALVGAAIGTSSHELVCNGEASVMAGTTAEANRRQDSTFAAAAISGTGRSTRVQGASGQGLLAEALIACSGNWESNANCVVINDGSVLSIASPGTDSNISMISGAFSANRNGQSGASGPATISERGQCMIFRRMLGFIRMPK